jgi:hypothetical protein
METIEKLRMFIDIEAVCIYLEGQEDKMSLYWHKYEFEEDGESALAMAAALHLYYTNPQELLNLYYKA